MTAAARSVARTVRGRASADGRRGRGASALGIGLVGVVLAVAWEVLKWLAGDPWRLHGNVLGIPIGYDHVPPLHWNVASDLGLPHVWSIVGAFLEPSSRFGPPVWEVLLGAAAYTFREAFVGFALGAALGLSLGIVFVRFRILERALVPYVVASQTVPLITIAPIVVIYLGAAWTSVALIAAYLTFFPVTVAALRGLRAADPRAFELMRASAASDLQVLWKLRLPASVPYLFSALRISAGASVVGAIIGELPSGLPDGLGGQILQDVQYYITGPEKLWATVAVAALLGIAFVALVRVSESVLTGNRYGSARTTTPA
jgi:NitT/TauT family transport system permease protein